MCVCMCMCMCVHGSVCECVYACVSVCVCSHMCAVCCGSLCEAALNHYVTLLDMRYFVSHQKQKHTLSIHTPRLSE